MTTLGFALLAGFVAVCVTVAIERWGGVLGGLLGTLPTTIVPAAAGMATSAVTTADLEAQLAVVPIGMLLNVGFLYLWRILPGKVGGRTHAGVIGRLVFASLLCWFVLALLVVSAADSLRATGFDLRLAGWATSFLIAGVGLWASRGQGAAPAGHAESGVIAIISRFCVAALAVGMALQLSQSGSVAAGVAAVFPAIFLTTMVSLWWTQGAAVPSGAIGPMMLGSTSVAVYAMLAAITLPSFGLIVGSLLAWGAGRRLRHLAGLALDAEVQPHGRIRNWRVSLCQGSICPVEGRIGVLKICPSSWPIFRSWKDLWEGENK